LESSQEHCPVAQTIFERAGGFATVRRIVSSFYDRVLESPTLSPYFEDVDMRRLIDHQTRFITSVMGGPASYSDDHLARTHARLAITSAHFDEVVGLLREALEEQELQPADIDDVERSVRARKSVIVSSVAR
jgi:hemoglobin